MAEKRGSIGFFSNHRPPVPLDIYSVPIEPRPDQEDEVCLTDGKSYNFNGQAIKPNSLISILNRLELATFEATDDDVKSGRVSGMLFVSERKDNLETLHIAIRTSNDDHVKVFNLSDHFYGEVKPGARMEDSGCVAGDYFIYVSTKDHASRPRQPWTAVFKTNIKTGDTQRLTPQEEADLSPSVSPSGEKIAVASFQFKGGWDGEMEDLKTDIVVMDVDDPSSRHVVVENGGWPSWGSDNVIFFHRKVGDYWGVFRADISNGPTSDTSRVTPDCINSVTPVAIDFTRVAVATFVRVSGEDEPQHRHIEIFDSEQQHHRVQITRHTRPEVDHFNPFLIDNNGDKRIGYHRCRSNVDLESEHDAFQRVSSPYPDVELFRVSGVFPTISKDGTKLALVDSDLKAVWLADDKGLRIVYEMDNPAILSLAWNQDPHKDILYLCIEDSTDDAVSICALQDVSISGGYLQVLTKGRHNDAFPSTNPDGTKLVFRSTRAWPDHKYKNLYLMDAIMGEYGFESKQLTRGECVDTQCQWSPKGDYIVFLSNRDKPGCSQKHERELHPICYNVFLLSNIAEGEDPVVTIVIPNDVAGHVDRPFFSPDGKSIAVAVDIAAVSADPVSLLPLCISRHEDIFVIDIDQVDPDPDDPYKNFRKRITHSRYGSSVGAWTLLSTRNAIAWNKHLSNIDMP